MAKIKICLDAGHYGKYNQSPVNKNYWESDMTWKLHLLLKKHLEEYGIEVITTRKDKDKDLGLQARGKKAKGCNLLLSLHSNAWDDKSLDYPLIIVPINGTGHEIGKRLGACVEKTMKTTQGSVCKSVKSPTGNWDYYSVIFGANAVGVTGIIIEHSFHTNLMTTNWLLQDSNLDKLARAEAEVIAEYYGLKKLSTQKSVDEVATEVLRGDWGNGQERYDRLTAAGYDYNEVQARVQELKKASTAEPAFKPYLVTVTAKGALNIRKGPGTNHDVVDSISGDELKYKYTIVEEANGKGATRWGLLKSYQKNRNGWISLDWTK